MIRIATINIWARFGDWPARREVLRRCIGELNPDVLALQETVVLGDYDQVADITDGYEVVHQTKRTPDGAGISIASRRAATAVHELDLHIAARPRDFPAGALLVELGDLLFVNHNPSWRLDHENERERQAVTVARKIEELAAKHVVVAGDMDADPLATSIRFWTGRTSIDGMSVCYRDAWEAKHRGDCGDTFTPHENPLVADADWPFGRIDYILVRCGVHGGPTMRINRCERWLDQPVAGVWASDHFGVVADL
ncbi:MAG TPA: endonuclease/exonuclease/phosphatase family protein, partial [Candidatus Dormibacteraeota bacterium]|nr:endonuclease/exonuclease/phosphatase family protein [Candidatus Dormibacteraeota bacterium]